MNPAPVVDAGPHNDGRSTLLVEESRGMAEGLREGPVAILFTDVEASTDLRTRRGDQAAHEILRSHDRIVRQCVERHDGRKLKVLGDGFMAVFPSIRRALVSALDMQKELEEYNLAHPDRGLRVRIGINAGEVITEHDDVFGAAVNAASRIAAFAGGGEILVSEVVKQLAGAVGGIAFRDRGWFELKGFPERFRLYEVSASSEEGGGEQPAPSGRVRILLVDDQALIRSGFRMILEAEDDFEVVGEAGDGRKAIEQAERLRPDVVLMDIRMPNLDGIEATRRLLAAGDAKVLILTTFDLDDYLFGAVKAGASGFLLKDVPPEDLARAIRAVARGDALIEPRMTRRLLEEFTRRPEPEAAAVTPERLRTLTSREMEVMHQMARGLSNAEIAEALFISETTVKTHVAHILTKLDLRDRIQAVVVAYETGLVAAHGGSRGDDHPQGG